MLKYALPALCASTLCVSLCTPVPAQVKTKTPKLTISGVSMKAGSTINSNVAGSVNGKVITWTALIDTLKQESPKEFKDAVAQAIGAQASDSLFGAKAKTSVTLTRADAIAALRKAQPDPLYKQMSLMLQSEVLNQEAAKSGVTVTQKQVNEQLTKILSSLRKQRSVPANITDEQFLATLNVTPSRARKQVRNQVLAFKMIDKELTQQFGHPVGPDDFLQARHILLTVPQPGPETKPEDAKKQEEQILAKITGISNDIQSGKIKFEDAAKDQSDDTTSKPKGGDIGVFIHGMMLKEFENAAYALKPGEISKPVRSEYGYHIIQLEKRGKDIPQADRDNALESLKTLRYQTLARELMTGTKYKIVNNVKSPPANMPPGMRPMPRQN